MIEYYNKKGEPMTVEEWSKKLGDFNYKVVEQTDLSDGKFVSTVWLGLDHSFEQSLPLIFETMVFPKRGSGEDLDMDRYTTLEEAEKGHKEMVKKWEKKHEAIT